MLTEPHGSGRLKVTVETTNSAGVPDNMIHSMQVVALTNASVEIADAVIRTPGTRVLIDEGVEEIHFYVQRTTAGQPLFAGFTVVDECGSWQSLAGAGAGLP